MLVTKVWLIISPRCIHFNHALWGFSFLELPQYLHTSIGGLLQTMQWSHCIMMPYHSRLIPTRSQAIPLPLILSMHPKRAVHILFFFFAKDCPWGPPLGPKAGQWPVQASNGIEHFQTENTFFLTFRMVGEGLKMPEIISLPKFNCFCQNIGFFPGHFPLNFALHFLRLNFLPFKDRLAPKKKETAERDNDTSICTKFLFLTHAITDHSILVQQFDVFENVWLVALQPAESFQRNCRNL